jgi:hypothetical protein
MSAGDRRGLNEIDFATSKSAAFGARPCRASEDRQCCLQAGVLPFAGALALDVDQVVADTTRLGVTI